MKEEGGKVSKDIHAWLAMPGSIRQCNVQSRNLLKGEFKTTTVSSTLEF